MGMCWVAKRGLTLKRRLMDWDAPLTLQLRMRVHLAFIEIVIGAVGMRVPSGTDARYVEVVLCLVRHCKE
jgi:hypothetical protein